MGIGGVGLRITLGSVIGTSPTYTYSVVRPQSDRERYMRAAPMDLRSPSQHNWDPGRREAERTNRMATTVGVREYVRFRSDWVSTELIFALTGCRNEYLT
jgi:hypothetical protein